MVEPMTARRDRVQPRADGFRDRRTAALVGRRGSGGLVSGLAPLVEAGSATWIAAALSDADRHGGRARRDRQRRGPARVRLLDHRRRRTTRSLLRRDLQRDAVVRAPRPVRPGARARVRPGLVGCLGRVPPGQRCVRRAVGEHAPGGAHGAGAGLPPHAARPPRPRRPRRPVVRALPPHALRRSGRLRVLPRGARRAARRAGQPSRLRVPHRRLGSGTTAVVPAAVRRRRERQRCSPRASAAISTTCPGGSRRRRVARRSRHRRAGGRPTPRSCGWTGWSCRRTSSAASGPSTGCSRTARTCAASVVFVAMLLPIALGVADYAVYRDEVSPRWTPVNERWGTPDWQPVRAHDRRRLPPLGGRCCGATTCCS